MPAEQRFRRFVLKFHELELAWHDVQSGDVGCADDFSERPASFVVADGAVDGLVLLHGELGLMTEKSGKARLRIDIKGEHSVSAKCEILCEVRGGSGFPASSLEVHDRDDLQVIVAFAVRPVGARSFSAPVEIAAESLDVVKRVCPPAVASGCGPLPSP